MFLAFLPLYRRRYTAPFLPSPSVCERLYAATVTAAFLSRKAASGESVQPGKTGKAALLFTRLRMHWRREDGLSSPLNVRRSENNQRLIYTFITACDMRKIGRTSMAWRDLMRRGM